MRREIVPEKDSRPLSRLLTYQSVVFCMGADPKPDNAVRCAYSKRTIMQSNASGPETTNLFEMQRRMLWIRLQKLKGFVR